MKYTNKFPSEVEAYEVLEEELFAVAEWCGGEVLMDSDFNDYISVQGLQVYPGVVLVRNNNVCVSIDSDIFEYMFGRTEEHV